MTILRVKCKESCCVNVQPVLQFVQTSKVECTNQRPSPPFVATVALHLGTWQGISQVIQSCSRSPGGVEFQLFKFCHALEVLQARVGDPCASEYQSFQVFQVLKVDQPSVRDLRAVEVERFKSRKRLEVNQRDIRRFGIPE